MSTDIDKYLAWEKISQELKELKASEAKLRTELALDIIGDNKKKVKLEVDGYLIEATPKVNSKVDEAILDSIFPKLSKEEKASVAFKPKLAMRNYNKLDADSLLNEAVTMTPGRPTLKISVLDTDPI